MIRLTKQQVIMLYQDVIAQSGGSPEKYFLSSY